MSKKPNPNPKTDYTRNVINYISKNVLESQPDKDQGGETSPNLNDFYYLCTDHTL